MPMEPLELGPTRHALRGFSATVAAGTLLASLLRNRKALLSLRPEQLAALRLAKPSRNALTIAVFVGVFRFFEKLRRQREGDSEKEKPDSDSTKTALIAASVAGALVISPQSRTPLVALLATNAVSSLWDSFVAKHPELGSIKHLDLAVFMASGGWIMYSALLHPESYEPSHMKLIMKYSLTTQDAATYLQERYKLGLNPHTCEGRHAGRECTEFLTTTFVWQVIALALRIYTPVHTTTWLLALRHKAVRDRPFWTHLKQLATRIIRSALYYIVFIVCGWTIPCYTKSIGGRSLAWRKFQFLMCGSLPALSILLESPSRRRPVGVILSSYSFVSAGTVLAQNKHFQWLQQGSGPVRTLLDVAVATFAIVSTFEGIIDGSVVLQRMLYGKRTSAPRKRVEDSPAQTQAQSN